jgi:hypothetical protein
MTPKSLRALMAGAIDYAGLFPPAKLPMDQAIRNYARYRQEPESWMLGRFVCPAARFDEVAAQAVRPLTFVGSGIEHDGSHGYLESIDLDEVARRGARAKVRCGGERIPPVEELAAFVRGCRARRLVFKATAGLHTAYPTEAGEHGFLNLLAAALFGDEEAALRDRAFRLDADGFAWRDRVAGAEEIARVRREAFVGFGSCSVAEPVAELVVLGVLPA